MIDPFRAPHAVASMRHTDPQLGAAVVGLDTFGHGTHLATRPSLEVPMGAARGHRHRRHQGVGDGAAAGAGRIVQLLGEQPGRSLLATAVTAMAAVMSVN